MAAVVLEVGLSDADLHHTPRQYSFFIDGWGAGIEEHVGGTSLVPSSRFKITEHHRHNLNKHCT